MRISHGKSDGPVFAIMQKCVPVKVTQQLNQHIQTGKLLAVQYTGAGLLSNWLIPDRRRDFEPTTTSRHSQSYTSEAKKND